MDGTQTFSSQQSQSAQTATAVLHSARLKACTTGNSSNASMAWGAARRPLPHSVLIPSHCAAQLLKHELGGRCWHPFGFVKYWHTRLGLGCEEATAAVPHYVLTPSHCLVTGCNSIANKFLNIYIYIHISYTRQMQYIYIYYCQGTSPLAYSGVCGTWQGHNGSISLFSGGSASCRSASTSTAESPSGVCGAHRLASTPPGSGEANALHRFR